MKIDCSLLESDDVVGAGCVVVFVVASFSST